MTPDDGPVRVAVDGTPLLGSRTGIGHYTAALVRGLAADDGVAVTATAFTARGGRRPVDLPDGVRWRHLPVPARALHASWSRLPLPPVELLTGRTDVFHATNFVLPPTARAAGVVTVHDLSYLRFPELVNTASLAYRQLVPRGLARARGVLTPTRAVADELVDAYAVDPELVTVTPLGVDPSWRTAVPLDSAGRARWGLPAEYLLAVGTFEPRKGLDILLRAYWQLSATDPEIPPLVLVGPVGWGEELDLTGFPPGRVVCPGYVPYGDLQRVVAGAAVFAFPSRYEGFGLPPLEALACGIPVVASDIATSVEVLGGFAALPPVGDVDALAGGLHAALHRPPDAAACAAGQAHAMTWTWDRCISATKSAYRRAAG